MTTIAGFIVIGLIIGYTIGYGMGSATPEEVES